MIESAAFAFTTVITGAMTNIINQPCGEHLTVRGTKCVSVIRVIIVSHILIQVHPIITLCALYVIQIIVLIGRISNVKPPKIGVLGFA